MVGCQPSLILRMLPSFVMRMAGCGTAPPVGPAGPFWSAGDGAFFWMVTVGVPILFVFGQSVMVSVRAARAAFSSTTGLVRA